MIAVPAARAGHWAETLAVYGLPLATFAIWRLVIWLRSRN